ncbi:hypothetical protein N9133_01195 [Akkermansiaceae bacterium]|nr:hypothetical protein [Akkermansiaceae bacterium]
MTPSQLKPLVVSLSFLACSIAAGQIATNNEWVGGTSSDWNTASNWSLETVPGANDNAGIPAGTPVVTTSATADLSQLLVIGNTLGLNHSLGIIGTPFIAGAPNIQPTGGFYLGSGGSTDPAILNINAGGSLTVTDGNFRIGRAGNSATLNLFDGGELTVTGKDLDIGRDNLSASVLNQTGGTLNHSGINIGDFKVGAFGGTGTYNLSGGTASVRNLRINFAQNLAGDIGKGVLNQTDGVLSSEAGFAIGWANRGDSEYNLSGGVLSVNGGLRMGVGTNAESTVDHTTTNTFTQTGGSVFCNALTIGEKPIHQNSYSISSGTLETNAALTIGAVTAGATGEMTISGDAEVTTNNLVLGIVDDAIGVLNLNGGVLNVNQILSGQTNTLPQILNLNGGTIKAKQNTGNLIHGGFALVPVLHENGITIDSNGFNVSVGTITGSGPITKVGEGTLSLRLPSTFIGDLAINEGTVNITAAGGLTFKPEASGVTNTVTGNGTGTFNFVGDMTIDLTDTATSGAWTLIDAGNLTLATYAAGFEVVGWTDQGDQTWAITENGTDYVFDEATGQLTAGAGANSYDSWAVLNGLTAANNGETQDPDQDGIPNILEFATGNNPLTTDSSIFSSVTLTNSSYDLEFTRSDESEAGTGLVLQYGSDLVGWTDIPVGAETSTDVTVAENDASPDTILISLDRSLALDGKLFVRLLAD